MMPLNNAGAAFEKRYASHLKHLKLQGLQTKTVDAYARAIRTLSYRVFFFTVYSLGLRLSEGLALSVADIDAQPARVHIRDSKGNRDRFVPLPTVTLAVLRRFWQEHRNPDLLFPNRHGGLSGAAQATTPLDRGGVQRALRQVALACGIKKKSARIRCATVMQPT